LYVASDFNGYLPLEDYDITFQIGFVGEGFPISYCYLYHHPSLYNLHDITTKSKKYEVFDELLWSISLINFFFNAISNLPYDIVFMIECHFYNDIHAEIIQEHLAFFLDTFLV
jgi:hypothetical protein